MSGGGPIGGPAIFGAQPAPMPGFQQAMAGEADDFSGARAVEVAAMLGDSVVGVKHCIDPKSGKVTSATWGMFALGAACLCVFVFSFWTAVQNAAYGSEKQVLGEFVRQPGGDGKVHGEGRRVGRGGRPTRRTFRVHTGWPAGRPLGPGVLRPGLISHQASSSAKLSRQTPCSSWRSYSAWS